MYYERDLQSAEVLLPTVGKVKVVDANTLPRLFTKGAGLDAAGLYHGHGRFKILRISSYGLGGLSLWDGPRE